MSRGECVAIGFGVMLRMLCYIWKKRGDIFLLFNLHENIIKNIGLLNISTKFRKEQNQEYSRKRTRGRRQKGHSKDCKKRMYNV